MKTKEAAASRQIIQKRQVHAAAKRESSSNVRFIKCDEKPVFTCFSENQCRVPSDNKFFREDVIYLLFMQITRRLAITYSDLFL